MIQLLLSLLIGLMLVAQSGRAKAVDDIDQNGRPRRVVIFSASFGGGHNASAEAIKAELLKNYPRLEITILYGQDYHHGADRFPQIASASMVLFNWLYQNVPQAYDRLYEATKLTAEGQTSAGDIPNPSFSVARIQADIERLRPDVIFSTWHLMTSKLIYLRERGRLDPKIPIAWLDTDFVQKKFYSLHSLGVDLTFLAHTDLERGRMELGVPAEKMVTTGLFVNPFVFEPFSDQQRRDFMIQAMSVPDAANDPNIWINGHLQSVDRPIFRLDPDPDVITVTIASGRAGAGKYATIIEGLVREARLRGRRIQIVAVCGENAKNYRAVARAYERMSREGDVSDVTLVASRFVGNDKLMKLVRSSQIFIGKSGSQSPFEAAVMGVPRVLIDLIGGQERYAAKFFARLGLAEIIPANQQQFLAARAFAFIEDPARMQKMREADQVIRDSYDPSQITKFFERAITDRRSQTVVDGPVKCRTVLEPVGL